MFQPFALASVALVALASSAHADTTLVECEGPNLAATLRYDSTRTETYGNDKIYLDVERGGRNERIDVFQTLEATLDDSTTLHGRKTFFLRYAEDGLILGGPMSAGRYTGIVRIEGKERNVACRVKDALMETLAIDVDADTDAPACVSEDDGRRIQDKDFSVLSKRAGVIGMYVAAGTEIGRPEGCSVLHLHVENTEDLRAAKATLGSSYKGMPISYDITGRAVAL
jgi:hypothetical protein